MRGSALPLGDAAPGAERLTGLADQTQGVGDLAVIVGVLMGEDHFGGRGDRARQVAVHLLHLGRPLPAVVVEVVAEPADPLRAAGGQRLLEAFAAVTAAGLFNGDEILLSRMLLHRNTPCAEYPLPMCVLGNHSSINPLDREQRLRGRASPQWLTEQ